jgi:succinyl-diaminopimelate desuccinylase
MELNKKIDELKDELISSTQRVVRKKSVQGDPKPGAPFGEDVRKCLDESLAIAKELGFKTVNMDGYIGYAEYGEGEDYVAVLGHMDVVPEGDGWIYPPYAAEIHDGKMYGRGTLDDKGATIASLYGLKAIKDLNLPLSKKVRVIFGTNEETGSAELEYYLKREKAPVSGFTPDADYPIIFAEKGITIFDVVKDLKKCGNKDITIKYINGGHRANMVPDYTEAGIVAKDADFIVKSASEFSKKTGYDVKAEMKDGMVIVKSIGLCAHGSLPELGKNAIMQLFAFLGGLPLGDSDIHEFIDFFNKNSGVSDPYGERFGVGLEDKASGKVSFNIGVVNADEKKISLSLNLRYPVTFKYDDMMNPFNAKLKGTGIRVENMTHQAPLYFPENHPLIKALQKVYTEQTGKEATLLGIGGGTYAKEMPNIVAFGPIFPGKPDLDHQTNEYMEIEDLIANAKIYAHAIYELAK